MKLNSLRGLLPRLSTGGGLGVLVVMLGVSFLAVVLLPGLELASELAGSTKTLKSVTQQQRYPTLIRASLDAAHDRLGTHGYVQESLDQLREASGKLDTAVAELATARPAGWFAFLGAGGGAATAGSHATAIRDAWSKEREVLRPVLGFKGVPYQDNESTGTVLNEAGKGLERDVNAAIRASKRSMPLIEAELGAVASELQASNEGSASQLRLVLLIGLAIAGVLIALVTVLLLARRRQDASLKEARQQTTDILRTVKDGLFLLDQNLIIGAAHSSAMESLFGRSDIAGLHFEQLLKNIVSEKTLQTAVKFVNVLWAERTKENLVKSINPLGEVEVSLDSGHGKNSARFLQFEFHRVRIDGKISQVLVSVSDVTARVDLARELASSQTQAQSQVDMLLGILQVDPGQLASFLNDSNAAMKMINAVLREPAREEAAFRKKLDTLFRQVHSVKGEAAALGLGSIESRAHSFEDDLKGLREKSDLSGNDFLPLVIKLDDLLTHLQSVDDLVSRISRLQSATADHTHTSTAVIEDKQFAVAPEGGVAAILQQLCAKVAAESGKEAVLQCSGLDTVPQEYRRIVKDIAVQVVRNAVVHGIESGAERTAAGKSSGGIVKLAFHDLGDAGYKLVAEDDGQGLSTERIKDAALKKGFITPEKAPTLDARQVYALLFQSGFSTLDSATKDAGRGVGMNVIASLIQQAGGKVSVATLSGKFTRLTMTLPPAKRIDDTAAA
jgi:two-component system, chemotaxis family, sensor kinase CheA